jgi:glycosyltransferase involved in cell wall biosynthesis
MADVGVVHPDLTARGGAEAVCMAVLEAVQPDHEPTLLTAVSPDIESLNRYYGRSVDPAAVRVVTPPSRVVDWLGRADAVTSRRLGLGLGRLRTAAFYRRCKRLATARRQDLLVGTFNELGPTPGVRSLQYVHHPLFDRSTLPGARRDRSRAAYDAVCRRVLGLDRLDDGDGDLLLANSEWTSDVVERTYGVRPRTLYPPVEVTALRERGRPWADREPGVVTVGRLSPEKNVVETVRVVETLRERGHDLHHHVVGPPADAAVTETVRSLARQHDWLSYEGRVDRETLVELLATHRYGLHGKRYEHFGIVVAEFVAAGAVPVVPEDGGQREVVDGEPAVLYGSRAEAVDRLDRLLSAPAFARRVRDRLPDVRRRFGPRRFDTEFRAAVTEAI